MYFTLVAGPNLIAWRYPAEYALKSLPNDVIDGLKLNIRSKYSKILKSQNEINGVYISKENQPVIL